MNRGKNYKENEFELPERIYIWEGPDSTPQIIQENVKQVALLKKYAEKGYAKAQYLMGYYCEVGLENQCEGACIFYTYIYQDITKAKEWYKSSARQGYPKAIEKCKLLHIEY